MVLLPIILFYLVNLHYAETSKPLSRVDYASSPIDFKNLVVLESQIVYHLLQILEKCVPESVCPMEHVQLQTYIEDFQTTLLSDIGIDINLYKTLFTRLIIDTNGLGSDATKNPLKVYRALRRIVKLFPQLMDSTIKEIDQVQEIRRLTRHILLPIINDLETSIFNLLRLNQIFKIPLSNFLDGKLGKIQTKCILTYEHFVEIGKVAFEDELYAQAVDAYDIALRTVQKLEITDKANKPLFAADMGKNNLNEIAVLLQEAIKQHDVKWNRIKQKIEYGDIHIDSGPLLFDAPLHNNTHSNFKNRTPLKLETLFPVPIDDDDNVCGSIQYEAIKHGYVFEQLCREEEKKTPFERAHLKCYYSSKSHPEFLINPLKLEVHNEDPLLIQYHNVFSDHDMQMYRKEVEGELRISKTSRSVDNAPRINRQRTSSNAWIEDYFHPPVFKKLLFKIGRFLGVDTSRNTGSEIMQVAAYSPGGHYAPHTDARFEFKAIPKLNPDELFRGDRIMTFMFYLSDVEEGGGTVFPIHNTYVKPEKGSALMWYNLHPDGTIDCRTLHGGCSVVYGAKWIANKWIHSGDQFYTRKCPATNPTPESWPLELHI